MSAENKTKRIGPLIVSLVVLLLVLRLLVWLFAPLLPILITAGALCVVYRWLFRQRYF